MWARGRRGPTYAMVVSLLLLLAACGGEDGNDSGSDDGQADTEGADEAAPAGAEDPDGEEGEDTTTGFYDGQHLEIIVPFGAGGGTDTLARFVAANLPSYLEGDVSTFVRNIEGAGGLTGVNEYVNRVEPDGYTMVATGTSNAIPFLLGSDGVAYDYRTDLTPVLGFPGSIVMWINEEVTGISSPAEVPDLEEPLIIGGRSPDSLDALYILALEMMGLMDEVEIVFGYPSASEIFVAFEQGEVEVGMTNTLGWLANSEHMTDVGGAPFFASGMPDGEGNLVRDPALPDFPSAQEAHEELHGEAPSGPAFDALRAFVDTVATSTITFWLHADAPPEAIREVTAAVDEMFSDPDMRAEAEPYAGPNEPMRGDAVDDYIAALNELDEEALQWARDYLAQTFDMDL